MRHKVGFRKLGRVTPHRIALLRNLATALFERERIRTTLMKAKELRPYAEKLITQAKRDDNRLHARRLIDLPAVPEWSDFDDCHVEVPLRFLPSEPIRSLEHHAILKRRMRATISGGRMVHSPFMRRYGACQLFLRKR